MHSYRTVKNRLTTLCPQLGERLPSGVGGETPWHVRFRSFVQITDNLRQWAEMTLEAATRALELHGLVKKPPR
jgi:hypothetical protein